MINYLKSNGFNVIERFSGGIQSETCPLCPKPHNNDKSNLWTLNFKENAGLFMCFRCGSSGNWKQFKKFINPEETDSSFSEISNQRYQEFSSSNHSSRNEYQQTSRNQDTRFTQEYRRNGNL
jgi:hypothetical protein